MQINSDFYGGNIECQSCTDPKNIKLKIKRDNNSDEMQWFYFSLDGAKNEHCTLIIENASEASYAQGFENYQAVVSYDNQNWARVSTTFNGKSLTIKHKPEKDLVYYAYFAPYNAEQHKSLLTMVDQSSIAASEIICKTLDNRNVELVSINQSGEDKKPVWILARQHAGETMASWWLDGCLERLLDNNDAVSRKLRSLFSFHIIPNMNPDGSARGHIRGNAIGTDLNRAWQNPTELESPEVYWVREKMKETGVAACIDVHGDEIIEYNFIDGGHGIPSWNKEKETQLEQYREFLAKINPDFQTQHGYPIAAPGKANLSLCNKYVAEQFNCLAMTLEMPFKDSKISAIPATGWSPERAKKLGASHLDALLHVSTFL